MESRNQRSTESHITSVVHLLICKLFVTFIMLLYYQYTFKTDLLKPPFTDASCNFDIWYCGWENGPGSQGLTWTRKFGPTSSRDTGPSRDHTSGSGKGSIL